MPVKPGQMQTRYEDGRFQRYVAVPAGSGGGIDWLAVTTPPGVAPSGVPSGSEYHLWLATPEGTRGLSVHGSARSLDDIGRLDPLPEPPTPDPGYRVEY